MNEHERAATRLSLIGFVFQFHFLLPEFTVLDNVMLPMRALGRLSRGAMRAPATYWFLLVLPIISISSRISSQAASVSG